LFYHIGSAPLALWFILSDKSDESDESEELKTILFFAVQL